MPPGSRAGRDNATVASTGPDPTERGARMHARLVTPLRNAVVLLASFFLLAVG